MIVLSQIQGRLQEAIKTSGMTQTELAKKLGVKQQTVACYVSGRAMPALDTFANLCVVLDVDPAEILCTNGAPQSSTTINNDFRNNRGTINNNF